MPDRADLNIYQGDDFSAVVTVYNLDGTTTDITGYTAKAEIRQDFADISPSVVIEITATVSSPYVNLFIGHGATATVAGRFVWDLQLISPSGQITTILQGNVLISQEVTRS